MFQITLRILRKKNRINTRRKHLPFSQFVSPSLLSIGLPVTQRKWRETTKYITNQKPANVTARYKAVNSAIVTVTDAALCQNNIFILSLSLQILFFPTSSPTFPLLTDSQSTAYFCVTYCGSDVRKAEDTQSFIMYEDDEKGFSVGQGNISARGQRISE